MVVLINSGAGTIAKSTTRDEAQRIRQALSDTGHEVDVVPTPGAELCEAARQAADGGADMVVAVGGDGTIAAVASSLVDTPAILGVIPQGTHNHFAREMNLPLELEPAARVLVEGRPRPVDVATVNGRLFINFAAIGFHPSVVRHRDAQRKSADRNKWLAMAVAMWRVLTRFFPLIRVRLDPHGSTTPRRRVTPSVVVCINPYQMKAFGGAAADGAGEPVDRSTMHVYLARVTSRLGLAWLMVGAALRLLRPGRSFETLRLDRFTLDTAHRTVHIGLDGELHDLASPLEFAMKRGALRVMTPGGQEGAIAASHVEPG